jgi:cyclic pyranopterin phosphate synthase
MCSSMFRTTLTGWKPVQWSTFSIWGETVAKLSHTDETGKARMVDVGQKDVTLRHAVASARVLMSQETLKAIKENALKKGDVLGVARVAGIMAAKKVDELIPLTHPIPIEFAGIEFEFEKDALLIRAEVKAETKTGVEIEALTAVAVAALTVYDMAKSADRGMEITNLRLNQKSGGRSGDFRRADDR